MKKDCAEPAPLKTEIISVKHLKKDGSLSKEIVDQVVSVISNGGILVMPIDRIYGIVGLAGTGAEQRIAELSGKNDSAIIRIISSFRVLDDIACFNKHEYDFLHRIWPGDVIVRLNRRKSDSTDYIPVFIPRLKFFQDLLVTFEKPVLFAPGFNTQRFRFYRGAEIIKRFKGHVDMILIVEEFCRMYPLPSVVDLSRGDIEIVNEGRMPAEEIKSLYFLDLDEVVS